MDPFPYFGNVCYSNAHVLIRYHACHFLLYLHISNTYTPLYETTPVRHCGNFLTSITSSKRLNNPRRKVYFIHSLQMGKLRHGAVLSLRRGSASGRDGSITLAIWLWNLNSHLARSSSMHLNNSEPCLTGFWHKTKQSSVSSTERGFVTHHCS